MDENYFQVKIPPNFTNLEVHILIFSCGLFNSLLQQHKVIFLNHSGSAK